MIIRVLEDGSVFKKGIYKVNSELGKALISNGTAVIVRENALDKQAHDSLDKAKDRDKLDRG
jgi:hypothetical protein